MLAAGHRFALPQLGPELLGPNPAPLTLLLCPAAEIRVTDANHDDATVPRAESNVLHFHGVQILSSTSVRMQDYFAWKVNDLLWQHDCLATC